MNLSDLFFLISALMVLLGAAGLLAAMASRRWFLVRRLALGLVIYLCMYAILLVGAALIGPQQVLAMRQPRCFDDWCASVEKVEQKQAIGAAQAQGVFYLVTIQVSSRAKRISQRALDADVYLVEGGTRYDLSPQGQRALEAAGQAGKPLNSLVDAGNSFTYVAVFDLPSRTGQAGLVITHGAFPGILIIGDDQSLFHKPTIIQLAEPG
jgi:hypothetical protein